MNVLSRKIIGWGFRDLTSADEMVKSMRGWAARSRRVDRSLAQALLYRAGLQIDSGRYPEALEGIDEVVALHGRANRSGRQRGLWWGWLIARAEWLRAALLLRCEEFDAAVRSAEDATDRLRALAALVPKRFEASYAVALGCLADCYSRNDRLDDAVRTGVRAAEIARRVHARGGGCDIAHTLANLSGRLHLQARDEEAVRFGRVAVNLLRRRPDPPLLANVLITLGASLAATRAEEALAAVDEAIAILGELVADHPAEHQPGLDLARRNRGIILRQS